MTYYLIYLNIYRVSKRAKSGRLRVIVENVIRSELARYMKRCGAASSFLTFLPHLVAILAFSLPPSSFSKIPRSQSPLLQP